jgi:hypothetical protein
MKKAKWLFVTLSTALVLSACGQSTDSEEDASASAEEAETQEETEDDSDEEEADADEEEEAETDDEPVNDEEEEVEDETAVDDKTEEAEETEESDESTEGEGADSSEGEGSDGSEGEETAVLEGVDYYFSDDQMMATYRVSTDHTVSHDEEGAREVVQTWVDGPDQGGLYGLFDGSDVTVQSVTFDGQTAYVSFSADIWELNLGSSGELMLSEQLAMLMSQFGFDQTQLLVDGEVPDYFHGHLDVSEPFTAGDASDYQDFQ